MPLAGAFTEETWTSMDKCTFNELELLSSKLRLGSATYRVEGLQPLIRTLHVSPKIRAALLPPPFPFPTWQLVRARSAVVNHGLVVVIVVAVVVAVVVVVVFASCMADCREARFWDTSSVNSGICCEVVPPRPMPLSCFVMLAKCHRRIQLCSVVVVVVAGVVVVVVCSSSSPSSVKGRLLQPPSLAGIQRLDLKKALLRSNVGALILP